MMNSRPEIRLTVNQGELRVTCNLLGSPAILAETLLVQDELSAGSPTRRDPAHSQLRGQCKTLRGKKVTVVHREWLRGSSLRVGCRVLHRCVVSQCLSQYIN
jgi:hypothetical protein